MFVGTTAPRVLAGLFVWLALTAVGCANPQPETGVEPTTSSMEMPIESADAGEALDALCDGFRELYPEHWEFRGFVNSYAVRVLAAVYEATGEDAYLELCRGWSDTMLEQQSGMEPAGAYYMGYSRKPGESEGEWFVADACSIAMGVLATAERCPEEADRERYMDSVRRFADLVAERFYRPQTGGITDGYWHLSDDEWWCSTALYCSLAYLLYDSTGEERYRALADGALDWLLDFDYTESTTPEFDLRGIPTIVFYTLEAFSAAWPHLEGERRQRVFDRFGEFAGLVEEHLTDDPMSYGGNWGAKVAGIPFHLLIYIRICESMGMQPPESTKATLDRMLTDLTGTRIDFGEHEQWQRQTFQRLSFMAMSLCESSHPGAIYHRRADDGAQAAAVEARAKDAM